MNFLRAAVPAALVFASALAWGADCHGNDSNCIARQRAQQQQQQQAQQRQAAAAAQQALRQQQQQQAMQQQQQMRQQQELQQQQQARQQQALQQQQQARQQQALQQQQQARQQQTLQQQQQARQQQALQQQQQQQQQAHQQQARQQQAAAAAQQGVRTQQQQAQQARQQQALQQQQTRQQQAAAAAAAQQGARTQQQQAQQARQQQTQQQQQTRQQQAAAAAAAQQGVRTQQQQQAQQARQQQALQHQAGRPQTTVPGPQHAQPPFPGTNQSQAHSGSRFAPPATPPTVTRQAIAVNNTTRVIPHSRPGGFAIDRQNADGSRTVMVRSRLPGGAAQMTGYRQIENRGTTTRIYSDGHRSVSGPDFSSHAMRGGPTFSTFKTGLHGATFAGKTMFAEKFATGRARDGHEEQVVQRTVYSRFGRGGPVPLESPIVREYSVVQLNGEPAHVYRPEPREPAYYRRFWAPLPAPVVVADACNICPGPSVAFDAPTVSYTDPIVLMADLQLSTAFDEASYAAPGDRAESADVRAQIAELQQQIDAAIGGNETLKAEFAAQGLDVNELKAQIAALKVQQAMVDMTPVHVPEEVRRQVQQQMRLSLAQHRNGHQALLSDVTSRGYARIYLFQATAPLKVADVDTGEDCYLNTGDLIRFSRTPATDAGMAQMSVVASASNSCAAKQVVDVPLIRLQEMLNGFNERMDDNMKRVYVCTSASGGCPRS